MFAHGLQVELGQFDAVALDVVDAADVMIVGADDFHVLADLGGLDHGWTPAGVWGCPNDRAPPWLRAIKDEAMSDVVNLRAARKAKARSEAKQQAAANRAAFGRSKAEKTAESAARARQERTLDQAQREP